MEASEGGARLSLNQITVAEASVPDLLEGCRLAGIDKVALWRHKVAELGVERTRELCDAAGVQVTSLCRGGFFTGYMPDAAYYDHERAVTDSLEAIDEARALGTDLLVLVCGGSGDGELGRARELVAQGIERIAPHAATQGVRLGIEPLHPVYCADRSVIVTIDQALALAERHPADRVGLVIDAYHVWWDPELRAKLQRAGERIMSLHVCDWLLETSDLLADRGVMGDGVIALRDLREQVDTLGYTGPVEAEILSRDVWAMDPERAISLVRERYDAHVA